MDADTLAQLVAMARAMAGAQPGFDAEAWVRVWIETPVPALGGRRPVEVLSMPGGQDAVFGVLGAMHGGAYR